MSNRDRLKELAREGYTGADIAAELGLSRARVYQLAHSEGVSFRAYAKMRPHPQACAAVTGGVPMTATCAGMVSELLTAADLLSKGWQPYIGIVRHSGYDLIATSGAQIITVEVRTGRRRSDGVLIYARAQSRKHPPDHFAVVVAGEPVLYKPDLPVASA